MLKNTKDCEKREKLFAFKSLHEHRWWVSKALSADSVSCISSVFVFFNISRFSCGFRENFA